MSGMSKTLDTASYLSLSTLRKNGNTVETPVWFAAHGGALYVFSSGDAGKVKRLRNFPKARVAPCDMRGKLLGEWSDAQGWLVEDAAERAAAHRALLGKYGWQMSLLDFFSRLGGKFDSRAFIRIEVAKAGRSKGAKRG
jgi:uncharacterized protein